MRTLQSRDTSAGTTGTVRGSDARPLDRHRVQAPPRSIWRYFAVRILMGRLARMYSRVRIEGAERLPNAPAVLCFSHQNWADPFYVYAAIPSRPRVYFFGPEQEDMRRGVRNRLMRWGGVAVPYQPGNRGLVAATARVQELVLGGASIAIAGEGRIHLGEGGILPLREGAAYLSLRAGVPMVPVAIGGTSWLGFRRTVRVRIGLPIDSVAATLRRPTMEEVARLTELAQFALESLVADFQDQPRPGPLGRWLTELFNEWPEGARPPDPPRIVA